MDLPVHNRQSLYHKLVAPMSASSRVPALRHKASNITNSSATSRPHSPSVPRESSQGSTSAANRATTSPSMPRRVSYASQPPPPGFTPVMESVDQAVKNTGGLQNLQLPEPMTTDEFTRAVAVATVSALRHQQTVAHSPARVRASAGETDGGGGHGGHDAPSWSRTTSASVLLACTALYAIIAGPFRPCLF